MAPKAITTKPAEQLIPTVPGVKANMAAPEGMQKAIKDAQEQAAALIAQQIADGTAPKSMMPEPNYDPGIPGFDDLAGDYQIPVELAQPAQVNIPPEAGPKTLEVVKNVTRGPVINKSEVTADPNAFTSAPAAEQPPPPISKKPPSTRREVEAQRRGDQKWDDVADVFSGRSPQSKLVAGGLIDPVKDAQAAFVQQQIKLQPAVAPEPVVVEHKMPETQVGYRATQTFSYFTESGQIAFRKDQIITEQWIIDDLIKNNPHFIAADDVFVEKHTYNCASCGHLNTIAPK